MINFILNETKMPQLYYVGHSMGTLTAFALFSDNVEFSKKVQKFYALAPIMEVKNIKGTFKDLADELNKEAPTGYWARFVNYAKSKVLHPLFGNQATPNWMSFLTKKLGKHVCSITYLSKSVVCLKAVADVSGPGVTYLNTTRLPVYLAHNPQPTSMKTLFHFAQLVKSGKIQDFDYGQDNSKFYPTGTPTVYNLTKMQTPVALFLGGNDYLATVTDVKHMLPNLKSAFSAILLDKYNHMDFLWGKEAAKDIYVPIMIDIKNDWLKCKELTMSAEDCNKALLPQKSLLAQKYETL